MIAKRVEKVPPSGIREFFDLVLGMPEVISLGVGEPDFVTPWRIRERAITALEEGYTSYTSNKGLQILREGIARDLKKRYSLFYNPDDEIVITVGVSQGLDLALRAIINPRDKVIVVSPHYVAYPALAELALGNVLYLETDADKGFKIDIARLKALLKQKAKAIILNYPSNPTGVTYTKKEISAIWKVLAKEDLLVISDEIYHELSYEEAHISFASLPGAKQKTILLNGFSKGCAMTGFRVGYACGNKKVIEAMTKIHSFSMLCAPIVSQLAAVEALRFPEEVVRMSKEYKRRRDFIVKELNRIGLSVLTPKGAFYCFPSIKSSGMSSLDFAKKLLFQENVAVVPGRAFGRGYDDFVRISYANTIDNLKEAVTRIEKFLNKR
ncbi:MAG: aminotransferase class I/II-fold pyridoxal phosphate-dependent enzyme [Candidatus Omnitrophota bacterium]